MNTQVLLDETRKLENFNNWKSMWLHEGQLKHQFSDEADFNDDLLWDVPDIFVVVQIAKLPQGDEPLQIRKAWVGIEVLAYALVGRWPEDVGNDNYVIMRKNILIPAAKAIEALAKVDSKAALWYLNNRPIDPNGDVFEKSFIFGLEEVLVVSHPFQLIEYTQGVEPEIFDPYLIECFGTYLEHFRREEDN